MGTCGPSLPSREKWVMPCPNSLASLAGIDAINECEQVEPIKTVELSECCIVILSGFEKYQDPPETLYENVA